MKPLIHGAVNGTVNMELKNKKERKNHLAEQRVVPGWVSAACKRVGLSHQGCYSLKCDCECHKRGSK